MCRFVCILAAVLVLVASLGCGGSKSIETPANPTEPPKEPPRRLGG